MGRRCRPPASSAATSALRPSERSCASRPSASSAPARWAAASPPSPPRPASASSCSTSRAIRIPSRPTAAAPARAGLQKAHARPSPPPSCTPRPPPACTTGNTADHLELARRLRLDRRGDHRAAGAQAGALRAPRAAAQAHAIVTVEHVGHPDVGAARGTRRAVPAALPRHALLQSAALHAPARAHPHAGDGAGGDRRACATSPSAFSARAS